MFEPCLAVSWCQKDNLHDGDGSVKSTVQRSTNIHAYPKPFQKPKDLEIQEEKREFGEK